MQNLKITLVQPNIIWENPQANLEKYSKWLENLQETDVIILPEMFTTGFSMQPTILKEEMDGVTVNWMKKMAADKKAAVVASLIIEENGQIFNRAVWVFPERKVAFYDKRHLYTMAQENMHYSQGKSKTVIEYKGWRFCPMICYDLRFPVWSRNAEDYDVLFYMANWPSPRHHVWKNLLVARAIENQSYCFGINRTGSDGAGLHYLGDSAMVSPKGFADFMGQTESHRTFEIAYNELHEFRKKFPLLDDRDGFEVLQ